MDEGTKNLVPIINVLLKLGRREQKTSGKKLKVHIQVKFAGGKKVSSQGSSYLDILVGKKGMEIV